VLNWREVVAKHHSTLVDELATHIDSELQGAVIRAVAAERSQASSQLASACEDACRSRTESLNQALRRLRQATAEDQILRLLGEGCAPYAERLVVLVFENNQAHAASSQGFEAPCPPFDIVSAPAIVAAIESRDPVISLLGGDEISTELASMFAEASKNVAPQGTPEGTPEATEETKVDTKVDRAYLFPVSARLSVVAMLIASGPVTSAPIELLCEAAGMRLETLLPAVVAARAATSTSVTSGTVMNAAAPQQSGLVQLATKTPPLTETRSWGDLSQEDQRLHLQAQRTARLRVAEMRLYHEEALRRGVDNNDIYAALQTPVDAARSQFLQSYLSKSPTMVDYLHLEILRSLAHNDDRLLGQNYPGPMV
jgi:hypothetical protein